MSTTWWPKQRKRSPESAVAPACCCSYTTPRDTTWFFRIGHLLHGDYGGRQLIACMEKPPGVPQTRRRWRGRVCSPGGSASDLPRRLELACSAPLQAHRSPLNLSCPVGPRPHPEHLQCTTCTIPRRRLRKPTTGRFRPLHRMFRIPTIVRLPQRQRFSTLSFPFPGSGRQAAPVPTLQCMCSSFRSLDDGAIAVCPSVVRIRATTAAMRRAQRGALVHGSGLER
jgi:hypothetical protein